MPKAVTFKANSIVYFKEDLQDAIYILNKGAVVLKYNDIVSGAEINEIIKTGEFFGVKSALGHFPREETAMVLKDSVMLVFSTSEFEAFAKKNTRVIMKMLKVFSKQLRRIHKKVQGLLSKNLQDDPEHGLFHIGQYYLSQQEMVKARYALNRYLTFYPSGEYATEAAELIQQVDSNSVSFDSHEVAIETVQEKQTDQYSEQFYNVQSLVKTENFEDADKELQEFLVLEDSEYYIPSLVLEVKVSFGLKKYDECINKARTFVQTYPKYPKVPEILYYIGLCYNEKQDAAKAMTFFNKVLSISEDESLKDMVQNSLRKMRG